MRKTFTLYTILFLLIFLRQNAGAQCNTSPCGIPTPSVNAQDACVLPSPSALDCYYGQTTPDPPVSFPPSWCTVINNNHWFAFTADAPTATFDISCFGCASGNGIQAAVLSTSDCIDFNFVSPCLGNIATQTTQTLVASGLTPGEVYYLCIDGSGGALCDYAINGSVPTVNGPTSGACLPSSSTATYTTTTISDWSINPPGAGVILGNTTGTSVQVNWQQPGPVQVCAQSTNCPNAPLFCLDVNVGEDTESTEEVSVCQGQSVTCAGKTFTTGGTFNVTLPSYLNCDSVVKCVVTLIPKVFTTETVYVCQGQSVTCAGVEFYGPGSFPVTLQGDNGCDSIVTCKVNLIPTTVSPYYQVNLCGPAEYYMCDNVFTSSGIYTEICTSSQGCDSIVNVNLAILEPVVVIAPPDTLDCNNNATIILDGSASSQNSALGGTTTYKWTGPGILGLSNQSTVQINQPGTYCLVMTHGRGGVYCSDTACVNVSAISAVPQLPLISGISNPCADSTVIYSATAVGNPPPLSFNWTTPNSIPYTVLSQNSIQITWIGAVDTGLLCVTANNACGASAPACLPIDVQQALITPQMTGPANVCAGGGNYLFTLNIEQAGTTYNWTVPAGAVLSGGGDSVTVNFLNSSSGQVCVTAQNGCGTGTPVCTNVQVSPIPTAGLANSAEICAGETVDLTFSLGGNGPFDVTWTDGSQNLTLNNITSGHTVAVSPAQTTVYRLLTVSDNTTPACTITPGDSVTVTVWQHVALSQTAQICEGETILLGGAQQNTSGVYVDSLQTIHGCDSVITTTLTVYEIDSLTVNLTTCDPAAAGTSTAVLTQTNGCDSVVTTIVTLLPSDTTLIFDTSCDPANVGVFTQNLTNVYGCDSTVTTTITYSLSDTTYLTGTDCDPAATGVFTQNLTTVDGCDSLIITTVTLLPSDTTYLGGSSCNPAEVGVFTQNLTNVYGCDSTVITTIDFFHLDTTFLTAQNCDPAATGVFSQTLVTAGGCDSVIITTVSLLPSNTTNLTGSSCNPAEVGVFTQNLTNVYGCDSTVITTISFFSLDTTFLTAQNCDPAATGVFSQTLTTAGGCDSVIVTTVSLLPSNTTNLTGASCNPAEVGVFTQNLSNQYGCDSTVITTITFFHLDTTYLTAQNCDPAATGVFSQTLVTAGGCDSVIITTVSLLPSDQVAIQSTTCDPAAAGVFTYNLVNQYGCDSTVTETVTLLPSSTTNLAFSTCDPVQVGTVTTVLVNQWGCDSTVVAVTSLLPPASCGVTVSLSGSNIPCGSTTGTLTLTATLGEAPFDYTVLSGTTPVAAGTLNAVGVPELISGLAAGNYTVSVSSVNGFSATAQATVVQLVPPVLTPSVVSNYNGYAVSCTGDTDGSAKVIATGGLSPYTYTWSNGGNTQQINNIGTGSYSVTVTDANNCTSTASITLNEPTPLAFSFTVNDLDCFGQNDGAIFVEPMGGVPPYRYSLDNVNFQNTNVFYNLNSGVYMVTTLDANDCQRTETILINAAIPLVVDLGDNQTIEQGGSTVLQAIVNVPADSILSVVWTPPFDSSECPECLVQEVAPLVSTTYSVEVTALNGCSDNDKVVVIVDRRRHVFIPNVFSPNNDGENDILSVFAKPGTVRSIKSFQVFDRWGEAVYVNENFQPNDPTIGWDGRLKGQFMTPGVFVWYVEVEFIDGVVELFEGDVTIIR